MCIRIPLTQGQFALVDEDDYSWFSQWRWRLNSKGYAIRSYRVNGQEIVVCMHRLILNAQSGQYVDLIDQNRLNNVRSNLRLGDGRAVPAAEAGFFHRAGAIG